MRKNVAVEMLESLASGIRLDVYRLLLRQGPQGMVAGAIAAELDLPPANLSFHLKAMTRVGLVTVEQQGRFQRYRANIRLMNDLIAYLTEQCCAGHPDDCLDRAARSLTSRCRAASGRTHARPLVKMRTGARQ